MVLGNRIAPKREKERERERKREKEREREREKERERERHLEQRAISTCIYLQLLSLTGEILESDCAGPGGKFTSDIG